MKIYRNTEGKPFVIKLEKNPFIKGEIVSCIGGELIVRQVYKDSLWERVLILLGFRVKLMEGEVLVQLKK